jgi:ribosomal 50S subunit-associated protein YjgA (DUF615 family)
MTSESIPVPLDLLAETRQALDAAALLLSAHPACTQIEKARAKIDAVVKEKSDTMPPDKRQEGYQLLRHLDEVRRKVKKDYGIEK